LFFSTGKGNNNNDDDALGDLFFKGWIIFFRNTHQKMKNVKSQNKILLHLLSNDSPAIFFVLIDYISAKKH